MEIVENPNVPDVVKATTELGTQLRDFTIEQVEIALRTLALLNGNYSATSRLLDEEFDIEVHTQTVKKWANEQFPAKYAFIQTNLHKDISTRVIAKLNDVAVKGVQAQDRLLDLLHEQLDSNPDITLRELAPSIRGLAQSTESNLKQKALLEGSPTEHLKVEGIDEVVAFLKREEILLSDDDIVED